MELRSGSKDPSIGGVFFIVVVDGTTYMWDDIRNYVQDPIEEDGPLAKWCKWPEEWHPLRDNETCSPEYFEEMTGFKFQETVDRDIVP